MQHLRKQYDLMGGLEFEHEPAFVEIEKDFRIVALASQMAGDVQYSEVEALLALDDTLLVYKESSASCHLLAVCR